MMQTGLMALADNIDGIGEDDTTVLPPPSVPRARAACCPFFSGNLLGQELAAERDCTGEDKTTVLQPPSMPRARAECCLNFGCPMLCQEVVPESDCGNCNVVEHVDYVTDIDAPVDYSLENIPTRCADYLLPGGDTFFEYDSDEDMYMNLRDSSSDEDEKKAEEKFVRRFKRRALRRRIRMERRQRGRDTEWSVEEMVQWLVTPEGDPDSCSYEDSLTDFASDEIAE